MVLKNYNKIFAEVEAEIVATNILDTKAYDFYLHKIYLLISPIFLAFTKDIIYYVSEFITMCHYMNTFAYFLILLFITCCLFTNPLYINVL